MTKQLKPKIRKKPDLGPAETLYVEMLSLLAQDKIEEAELKAKASRSMGLLMDVSWQVPVIYFPSFHNRLKQMIYL